MPVPFKFDGFVEHSKRVSSTCLITFEHNRYSDPASFANRPVSLRVYADRLIIVAEVRVIAEHNRIFTRDYNSCGKTVYDWRHYLSVVQRKPRALCNGGPFWTCRTVLRHCSECYSSTPVVTGKWWISSRWCYYMMKRRWSGPWRWHWRLASLPSSMS